MTRQLWAPWRLEYVQSATEQSGCVFCVALAAGDAEGLVAALGGLADEEALGVHRLAANAIEALGATFRPDGFNLGWNLGRVAGAGIVDHVHLHVVPRWSGDTNFMPVLADVKVLPEHLLETRDRLRAAWPSG